MKIVHIITGLSTGGAEMMLYKLLSGIDNTKITCEVVSLTETGLMADRIKELGIKVHILGMRRGRIQPRAIFRLSKLLRQIKPDLVQTWLYHSDLIGGLAAKLSGGTTTYWNIRQSNIEPNSNKRSTLYTAKLCAVLSRWIPDKIICCSHSAMESHRALGYGSKNMQVIPNGFDLTVFKPAPDSRLNVFRELELGNDAKLIGLVARFDLQKDHHNFIQATKKVIDSDPSVQVLLCGEGIDQDNDLLTGWVEETGYAQHYHLLGPRQDTNNLFAAMDIAISSSLGEGFSNVIGEAMSCAVPCVVTDVGDSALIVGDTGTVVPAKNPQALAGAVIDMLRQPAEQRTELGRKARERIESLFSIENIVRQYEQAYLGGSRH